MQSFLSKSAYFMDILAVHVTNEWVKFCKEAFPSYNSGISPNKADGPKKTLHRYKVMKQSCRNRYSISETTLND